MKLRNTVFALLLGISFTTSASVTFKPLNERAYQKSLYEAGVKAGIDNAAPLAKQSFALYADDKNIGNFISGQGFSKQDTGLCFVSWATSADTLDLLIPTIGKDAWEAETCSRTVAVGILSPENAAQIAIGVIYAAQSPNASTVESVIFSVDQQRKNLSLDRALTEKIGSQGATTLGGLKRLYQRQRLTADKALTKAASPQSAEDNGLTEAETSLLAINSALAIKPQPAESAASPEAEPRPAENGASSKGEKLQPTVNSASAVVGEPQPAADSAPSEVSQPAANSASAAVGEPQPAADSAPSEVSQPAVNSASSEDEKPQAENNAQPEADRPSSTAERALLQVENVVKAHKLVPDPACVNYQLTKDAEPGMDLVELVEKHSGGCPGDPGIEPRIFSVYVDQKTRQMLSDKDTQAEGNFIPLPPAE